MAKQEATPALIHQLMSALERGNEMELEMVLMQGLCPSFMVEALQGGRRRSLVTFALERDVEHFGRLARPRLTEMLLEAEANINQIDSSLRTPLINAVMLDYAPGVALLLQTRADPMKRELRGRETALHVAVQQGQMQIVNMLLSSRADPDAKMSNDGFTDGETPLERAEKMSFSSCVEILKQHVR
eukprot:s5490_g3.t1